MPPVHHKCAIAKRSVCIPREHLMCDRHWFLVPVKMRHDLQRAARVFRASPFDIDAEIEWRDIADDAVHTVTAILAARGESQDAIVPS